MQNSKWLALSQFKPGGQQAVLFVHKLQQQTSWNKTFCEEAIIEYKRFVYLTTISKSMLSPSFVVDQVWHLHLTFSRCYWEDLCKSILGFDLHHQPAPRSKRNITEKQYQHTLHLYREHFQDTPSTMYWPESSLIQVKPRETRSLFFYVIPSSFLLAATTWASTNQTTEDTKRTLLLFILGLGFVVLWWLIRKLKTISRREDGKQTIANCAGGCAGGCGGCG